MLKFGKKYYAGNFYLLKKNKTLSKGEIEELRNEIGIPVEFRNKLRRDGVPAITVSSVSGHWSVEYLPMLQMYKLLDDVEVDENDEIVDADMLDTLFLMLCANTTVIGDEEFYSSLQECYATLIQRVKATEVSKKEDDKTLYELKENMDHIEIISELADDITKSEKKNAKKGKHGKKKMR